MQSKTNDQIRAERFIERSLGAGWNKPLKRGSGTSMMEDLLKYLSKIFKNIKFEEDRLTPDQMSQVILLTGEILDRDPPQDIQSAISNMDGIEVEYLANKMGYNSKGEDRCEYCGTVIDYEDYHTHTETENFWGSPAYRELVDGYTCHNCGEQG